MLNVFKECQMYFIRVFHKAKFINLYRFFAYPKLFSGGGMLGVKCRVNQITYSEDDLEEKFIKGFGKGGQKVNKSSNCVELRHLPTGITVKCHQTRYLERNRSLAREILKEKLDYFCNGKESKLAQKWAKIRKRKADYVRKRTIKNEILETSENSEDSSNR